MDRDGSVTTVLAEINAKAAGRKRVVFVSGNFNIADLLICFFKKIKHEIHLTN